MLVTLDLDELELVTYALDKYLSDRTNGLLPTTNALALHKRLSGQAKYWRRMRQPVKVAMTLNGTEYAVILNPASDEVEVRIAGIPSMSGEWRKPWFREGIDEEPEHNSIQRCDEYPGQPQPDDATLEVLSVALWHALVNR